MNYKKFFSNGTKSKKDQFKEDLIKIDQNLRFNLVANASIERKNKHHMQNPNVKFCPNCWFIINECICTKLKPITTKNVFITWLHYKEIWRGTNTGTLLPLSCKTSKSLIVGLEKDDLEIKRIFEEDFENTIILYPSSKSITV